ncbi:MAG: tripartite tricarboxylate transporter TctB family protein [Pseudomonadota bacterium]
MGWAPAIRGRFIGLVLVLVGAGALLASLQIPLDQYGQWGARIFPLIAGLAILVTGLAELWEGPAIRPGSTGGGHTARVLALLALAIAYVWALSKVGYLISTAVTAPLGLWLFGVRRPIGLLAAALLCPVAYHLIFFEALGVFPPLGEWIDLLDLIRGY